MKNNVENIGEVIDALKALNVQLDGPALQRMLKTQALPIIETARNLAPKETGNMAKSIEIGRAHV